MKRAFLVLFMLFPLAFFGCDALRSNQVTQASSQKSEKPDLAELPGWTDVTSATEKKLDSLGFAGSSAVKTESGFVVVERDLVFRKERLNDVSPPYSRPEGAAKDSSGQFSKQAVEGAGFGLVNYSNGKDVTVQFQSQIESNYYWTQAVRNALSEWKQISQSNLSFREVNSGADVKIYTEDNPYSPVNFPNCKVAGQANAPSDDETGDWIVFNTGCGLVQATRLSTAVHELGHTVGFRHTNWDDRSDGKDEPPATRIPHTPSSGNDPASIMNASVGPYSGFSSDDKLATRVLYGESSFFDAPYVDVDALNPSSDTTTYRITTRSDRGGRIFVQHSCDQSSYYTTTGSCGGEGCTFETQIVCYFGDPEFRAFTEPYMPGGPRSPMSYPN
jgi:hypothetical protein